MKVFILSALFILLVAALVMMLRHFAVEPRTYGFDDNLFNDRCGSCYMANHCRNYCYEHHIPISACDPKCPDYIPRKKNEDIS